MLDRSKVIKELHNITDKLFLDFSPEIQKAQEAWGKIVVDPLFAYKAQYASAPWLLPTWQQKLSDVVTIAPAPETYHLLGIDGSQIYPDRHQGTSCFLVNIGIVELVYGMTAGVKLQSIPYVFADQDDALAVSTDLVNCKRQELEFARGLQHAVSTKRSNTPFLFLFDGSLIFWHLESKDQQMKNLFLDRYIDLLEKLYQAQIPLAGYISLPKSKELVNLVRLQLCNFVFDEHTTENDVEHLVDAHIARFFFESGMRTIVFQNHSKITSNYPDHLKPHFFYLHVGTEVARIEIPAWLAHDDLLLNQTAALIMDQCQKGRGYPVALAEAHEQAVVKGPDRDFFYHLIQKVGLEQNQRMFLSQKVIKKRGLGI